MERAVALSFEGVRRKAGGPFGALIVREGEIVAEGWNCVTSVADPTAHAEVVAIRRACEALESHELSGCVLYSSCEPCPMCLAASYWARVDRIYFANTRDDAARIGFDDRFFYDELTRTTDQRQLALTHLPVDDSLEPMRVWFDDAERTPY